MEQPTVEMKKEHQKIFEDKVRIWSEQEKRKKTFAEQYLEYHLNKHHRKS
jgi:hypothetical protein